LGGCREDLGLESLADARRREVREPVEAREPLHLGAWRADAARQTLIEHTRIRVIEGVALVAEYAVEARIVLRMIDRSVHSQPVVQQVGLHAELGVLELLAGRRLQLPRRPRPRVRAVGPIAGGYRDETKDVVREAVVESDLPVVAADAVEERILDGQETGVIERIDLV